MYVPTCTYVCACVRARAHVELFFLRVRTHAHTHINLGLTGDKMRGRRQRTASKRRCFHKKRKSLGNKAPVRSESRNS